jgi:hypothetical protein
METWRQLADRQCGMLARRQLNQLGVDADRVRNQLAAARWREHTPLVISTFTGALSRRSQVWGAVLHAGGDALVGGITALEWYGIRNWHRDEITVLVDNDLSFDPVPGVSFFRTRRPLTRLRNDRQALPMARVEPATLLWAGHERSTRTAQGLLAAVVQQRLSHPQLLLAEVEALRPLRRARLFRRALIEIAGGSESMAELDINRMCRTYRFPRPTRQTRRKDSAGRWRYTDVEWQLPDGRILILEVDGGFHMEVEHWEDDIARQRQLSHRDRIIVRCTARELRDDLDRVARDLIRLGVLQLSA